MDKNLIKQKLIDDINQQIAELTQSVAGQRSHANDGELKSEGKYDTRATEAKYLADAMAQKLDDLQLDLQMAEQIPVIKDQQEVAIGSLVELEYNGTKGWYYMSPVAGGKMFSIQNKTILVISAFSPLGSELMGSQTHDEVIVEAPKGEKTYLVLQII